MRRGHVFILLRHAAEAEPHALETTRHTRFPLSNKIKAVLIPFYPRSSFPPLGSNFFRPATSTASTCIILLLPPSSPSLPLPSSSSLLLLLLLRRKAIAGARVPVCFWSSNGKNIARENGRYGRKTSNHAALLTNVI